MDKDRLEDLVKMRTRWIGEYQEELIMLEGYLKYKIANPRSDDTLYEQMLGRVTVEIVKCKADIKFNKGEIEYLQERIEG